MMNHKEIGWENVDWIYLPENREDGGHCERGSEPLHFIKCRGVFMSNWGTVSFPRGTLLRFISVHYIKLHYMELVYSVGPSHCVHWILKSKQLLLFLCCIFCLLLHSDRTTGELFSWYGDPAITSKCLELVLHHYVATERCIFKLQYDW